MTVTNLLASATLAAAIAMGAGTVGASSQTSSGGAPSSMGSTNMPQSTQTNPGANTQPQQLQRSPSGENSPTVTGGSGAVGPAGTGTAGTNPPMMQGTTAPGPNATTVSATGGQSAGFAASLSGAQEVPPIAAAGTGNSTVDVDRTTRTARWNVTYSGLTGPATMAHIHGPAAPGSNAPPLVWLSPQGQPVPNPIIGQATLTDEQMADLMAGRMYVNIHTQANPGGEIRGQLMSR